MPPRPKSAKKVSPASAVSKKGSPSTAKSKKGTAKKSARKPKKQADDSDDATTEDGIILF